MQIKKYIADNYSEALTCIKQEMGSDALILTTRSIRDHSGWDGGKASKVEITAAIDHATNNIKAGVKINASETFSEVPSFNDEVEPDMKSLMYSLLSQTERAKSLGIKSPQLDLFSKLVGNGLNEKIIAKVFSKASLLNGNSDALKGEFLKIMKRLFVCRGGIETSNGNTQKKVVLVGPTGAGKTTTISKIAADLIYRQKKKIALVSLDTFRVGGIEQLKIYGDIMGVPVEAAQDRLDLKGCLKRHSDKDVVLIDTMGRCHRDHTYSTQLSEVFQELDEVETHLVLSLGSNEKQFMESYKQFSPLGIDRVLFTKIDEGLNFGSMLNFSLRTRLPLSYLTTGQRVPEDIEVAAQDRVIRLIFN
jgi:flagellar biosynthesis protein FlhF